MVNELGDLSPMIYNHPVTGEIAMRIDTDHGFIPAFYIVSKAYYTDAKVTEIICKHIH